MRVSGLVRGERRRSGEPLPTLAEYYRGGLRLAAEPGTGLHLHRPRVRHARPDRRGRERASRWTATSASTSSSPSAWPTPTSLRSERVRSRLATGYGLRLRAAPKAVTDRAVGDRGRRPRSTPPRGTWPATSRRCSAAAPTSTARCSSRRRSRRMFEPHYQPDPRMPGMGLGVLPRATSAGTPSSSTRGCCPASTPRSSLAPDDGVGVMAFTNGARNAAMLAAGRGRSGCSGDLLGVPRRRDPHRRPAAPRDLGRHLRLVPAAAQLTDLQAWWRCSALGSRSSSGAGSSCCGP